MTWMKWRATYAEGPSETWEWLDLGCSGDRAVTCAREEKIEIAARPEFDLAGFRRIEYELVESPPREVLCELLRDAEESVRHAEARVVKLRALLGT